MLLSLKVWSLIYTLNSFPSTTRLSTLSCVLYFFTWVSPNQSRIFLIPANISILPAAQVRAKALSHPWFLTSQLISDVLANLDSSFKAYPDKHTMVISSANMTYIIWSSVTSWILPTILPCSRYSTYPLLICMQLIPKHIPISQHLSLLLPSSEIFTLRLLYSLRFCSNNLFKASPHLK